ncbi:Clcn7 [Symbiodinium necroappetens]|uniref:Clcn7 protein n=1 Tax=Symbiodinium necroappetens TaxID=1628268 RepID=A0A812YST5_9DINO|nr:Clcn7 [Symbiodinium necroappetens]
MVAEVCLEEASQRFQWQSLGELFPGMPYHDVLFMDDCIIWSRGVQGLERKIRQLMVVLSEFGLKLNGGKCQLVCSPHWTGPKHIMISGEKVEAVSEMEVMGLPMRVDMTTSELVAPLVARARSKFWSLHHVFRSKTSLRGRLRTLATVVGNSALWPLAAFPPDRPAMGLLNTMQLQVTIWTMRVAKRPDEVWDAFRLRAYRGARAALHASGAERWSTTWLRHFPRLANLERDMHKAAHGLGGCNGFNVGKWEANEDTGPPDCSCGSALLCSYAFVFWCEVRRVLKDLSPSHYTIMPKMTAFFGEGMVTCEAQGDECLVLPCCPVGDFGMGALACSGKATPGMPRSVASAVGLAPPVLDAGRCEEDRREMYPVVLNGYTMHELILGKKVWGLLWGLGMGCMDARLELGYETAAGLLMGQGAPAGFSCEVSVGTLQGRRPIQGVDEDVDGDMVVMMQGYLPKDVSPRADGIPRREFEELVADFRPSAARGSAGSEVSRRGRGTMEGPVEADEEDDDTTGLFQTQMTARRTWEQLMDLFWGWRADRDDEAYMAWCQGALALLFTTYRNDRSPRGVVVVVKGKEGPGGRDQIEKIDVAESPLLLPPRGQLVVLRMVLRGVLRVEVTAGDGPFIPDARADYIRRVISGFTAEQQALITLGLMTVLRAILAELGVDDEDDDGIPTLMLQVDVQLEGFDALSLVQKDVTLVSGVMARLQDALMGGDLGLARVRAEHLRSRVHRLRLGSFVDRDLADRVEALCVVVEENGLSSVAGGFHAMPEQVSEWTWSWWRTLEPMLHIEQDNPPVQPDTLQVTSSAEASLPGSSISDAEVARLVADQEENRRDEEALREQQERFEAEESKYYEGVEAVVAAEVELQTSRACKEWDDWAVWDEMNRPIRSRKRAFLEVMVSSPGGEGGGQRWSVPFDPHSGQQVVLKFYKSEVEPEGVGGRETRTGDPAESAGSDASTIPASGGDLPREVPACGVPLEFQQFQKVYEQWNEGQLSNDAVKQQFGVDTLELLETQKIVLGPENCRGHSAWNGSSLDATNQLRGEGNAMMSGGSLMVQNGEGKPSVAKRMHGHAP